MSGEAKRRGFRPTNRLSLFAKCMVSCAALIISCRLSTVHAAVIWSGDVSPLDPTTWTSGTYGYIGETSTGTITVDGGSRFLCRDVYVGYGSSSNGTLNIEASGQVNTSVAYLGFYAGSNGTVTVSGAGSQWTNTAWMYIGSSSSATLTIEAGGQVSSSGVYLGQASGATGTVTVTGTGSKLIDTANLRVGEEGHGTLTVSDGGIVIVSRGIFASMNDLFGNGTISTNGGVLDADLVFDASHGLQYSIPFGTGGTLTLTQQANVELGVGYKGKGTLQIKEGIAVSSLNGYLGYYTGSTGTATVSGSGSKWTNNGGFYVGKYGNGILNVELGGQVINASGYLGYDPGSTGTVNVVGTGSQWTSNSLTVGLKGKGTLNIEAGGLVTSTSGWIGQQDGSIGLATVVGTGSKWIIDGHLRIGGDGIGTLNIEAGGQVSNQQTGYLCNGTATISGANSLWNNNGDLYVSYFGEGGSLNILEGAQVNNLSGHIGYLFSSMGRVTVSGTGSKWTNNGDLYVDSERYGGGGTLTVTDGGTVVVNKGLFASLGDLLGNGPISTNGGVLDADLIFDAAHGLQNAILYGSGGCIYFTQGANSVLGAGYKSNGTIRIADGKVVSSVGGYLGYKRGAIGTATVTGTGSRWTNSSSLYVGYEGQGTLNIEAGGQVVNTSGSIIGTVIVTGTGSRWANSSSLSIGTDGSGTLNIEAGGQVSNTDGQVSPHGSSTGKVTVSGAGSRWTNNGYLSIVNGVLDIKLGGEVSNTDCTLGPSSIYNGGDKCFGDAKIAGVGSKWTNSGTLFVGTGKMNIEEGGKVSTSNCYLGINPDTIATATVMGTGSQWTTSGTLHVGKSGNGTLNIGNGTTAGAVVIAATFSLATNVGIQGVCNINGGTLKVGNISQGSGSASFNWIDGTIQNHPNTGLVVSNNIVMNLFATGTHALNIDKNRMGTINGILSDTTSGGSLKKIGLGILSLTAANSYSGQTRVEEGLFKVTGSILNTSGIDIAAGATLELAKATGNATAATLAIANDGTTLISAGSQTVGTISGTGITQVKPGATLTATSIMQNSLSIGVTGTAAAGMPEQTAMNQVPEPGAMVILLTGVLGGILLVRRGKRCM